MTVAMAFSYIRGWRTLAVYAVVIALSVSVTEFANLWIKAGFPIQILSEQMVMRGEKPSKTGFDIAVLRTSVRNDCVNTTNRWKAHKTPFVLPPDMKARAAKLPKGSALPPVVMATQTVNLYSGSAPGVTVGPSVSILHVPIDDNDPVGLGWYQAKMITQCPVIPTRISAQLTPPVYYMIAPDRTISLATPEQIADGLRGLSKEEMDKLQADAEP